MTRKMRLTLTAALLGVAAACNPDDSGNVMAAPGNALTPEQVDRALGPELTGDPNVTAGNEADAAGTAANAAGERAEDAEARQPETPSDNASTDANSAEPDGEPGE
jgi:hypothetical protein